MKPYLWLPISIFLLATVAWIGVALFTPQEMPLYPSAQHVDRTPRSDPERKGRTEILSFTTADNPQQVMDYYKRTLAYKYDECTGAFRQKNGGVGIIIWVDAKQQDTDLTSVKVYMAWGGIAC